MGGHDGQHPDPRGHRGDERGRRDRFTFAELAAGTTFLFKIDVQVNPDIVIGNEGSVTIYDGSR